MVSPSHARGQIEGGEVAARWQVEFDNGVRSYWAGGLNVVPLARRALPDANAHANSFFVWFPH